MLVSVRIAGENGRALTGESAAVEESRKFSGFRSLLGSTRDARMNGVCVCVCVCVCVSLLGSTRDARMKERAYARMHGVGGGGGVEEGPI